MLGSDALRILIEKRLAELANEVRRGDAGTAVVSLDQQSVGRLSRQDALLSQSMAKANQARRDAEAQRLRQALIRLQTEPDEAGYCVDCGEYIGDGRLQFDPSVTLCISCARG